MDEETGAKFITTQNAIDLKEIINTIRKMVSELLHGKVGIFTMECISTTKEWASEKCTGPTAPSTKESG